MPIKDPRICAKCDQPVSRNAKYCWEHRPVSNRRRDLQNLAKNKIHDEVLASQLKTHFVDEHAEKQALSAQIDRLIVGADSDLGAWRVPVVGLLLSIEPDGVRACELAGLHLASDEAKAIAEDARARFPELVAGSTAEVGRYLRILLGVCCFRSLASLRHASPAATGQLMRSVAQVIESYFGGSAPTYGEIKLLIPSDLIPSVAPTIGAAGPKVAATLA